MIGLVVTLSSCRDDVFERDLSKETVNVIIPQANYQSTIQQVHFKWEAVEGASQYRIQLVSPDFNNIQAFILDSVVQGTEFFYNLEPGTYAWKMRAENNSSETPYITDRIIQIDSTNDVSGQTVDLILPLNASYTNQTYPGFSWLSLSSADGYDVVVKTGSDFLTGTTVESSSISGTSYTLANALSEGDYIWGVRATNSSTSSSTSYSTRTFRVDLTVPDPPTLITPDGDIFSPNQSFTYTWTQQIENGAYPSPLADSVYIYTDPSLTTLYKRFTTSSSSSYLDSIPTIGTYYWRAKTFDEAGNIGSFSSYNSFTIQ